jgi:hypothetical protein
MTWKRNNIFAVVGVRVAGAVVVQSPKTSMLLFYSMQQIISLKKRIVGYYNVEWFLITRISNPANTGRSPAPAEDKYIHSDYLKVCLKYYKIIPVLKQCGIHDDLFD